VIAIDQDPLGEQATTVSNLNGQWKLTRPLADSDRAVALFNAGASDWALASADFASLGLEPGTAYLAKDLWSKRITKLTDPVGVAFLPSHATAIYRVSKRPPAVTVPAAVAAQSPGAGGVAVSYAVSAKDALDGALDATCSQPSGSLFPIGPTRVTCTATDLAGRSSSSSFVVQVAPPEHPLPVGGTVPATLSLTLGAPASFGAFTPGVANDYSASTTANVISTAGDATLSVGTPGHLANGTFTLPEPLQVLGVPKLYAGPVSNDVATIGFRQHIGASDALRTGSYSTTLTFTLSTTTP
jgi:X-Pro dipeptidyl-peptidase